MHKCTACPSKVKKSIFVLAARAWVCKKRDRGVWMSDTRARLVLNEKKTSQIINILDWFCRVLWDNLKRPFPSTQTCITERFWGKKLIFTFTQVTKCLLKMPWLDTATNTSIAYRPFPHLRRPPPSKKTSLTCVFMLYSMSACWHIIFQHRGFKEDIFTSCQRHQRCDKLFMALRKSIKWRRC